MPGSVRFTGAVLGALLAAQLATAQTAAVSLGEPATDPDAPIEVTSEALSVDRETGNAIFTGNVFVIQGDMTLNADRVEVLYSEDADDDEALREVIASGSVVLVNGEDTAESDFGTFYPPEDRVVMTGNVLLTQGRSIISGDIFNWNMLTGQGTMEGRVRSILQQRASE
jgi:lipopolysaccharide export system protein LptA